MLQKEHWAINECLAMKTGSCSCMHVFLYSFVHLHAGYFSLYLSFLGRQAIIDRSGLLRLPSVSPPRMTLHKERPNPGDPPHNMNQKFRAISRQLLSSESKTPSGLLSHFGG